MRNLNKISSAIFIILLLLIIFTMSSCQKPKESLDSKVNNESNWTSVDVNDSSVSQICTADIAEIRTKVENEINLIDVNRSVSILVCNSNLSNAFELLDNFTITDNMMSDIMHVWLFYLSTQDNIANPEEISQSIAKEIYYNTLLDEATVQKLILNYLTSPKDDKLYPSDLGLFKGRDRNIIKKNIKDETAAAYLQNLLIFKDSTSASDCSKIITSNFRDELILDACNLRFIKDIDSYCGSII